MKTINVNGKDYVVSSERELSRNVWYEIRSALRDMEKMGASIGKIRQYKVNINGQLIPIFNPATGEKSKKGKERLHNIFYAI